jgi:photosystem II stability/assembly factor-like uncharacterized protein
MPYVFVILSLFFAGASFAQSGWFELRPNVPGVYNDIAFLTPDSGYLITDKPAKLYATTNGGISWAEESLPQCTNCTFHFDSIFFAYGSTGYISGYSEDTISKHILLKTTDSGHTWIIDNSRFPYPFPYPSPSDSVAFRTDKIYFEKTIDGGQSWIEVDRLPDSLSRYLSFDFGSEQSGVLIFATQNPEGTAVKVTTDGGNSWQYSEIELLDDASDAYRHVKALDDSVYLIGGTGIYRSSESGRSWTWTKVSKYITGSFAFYNALVGYAAGFGGYLAKTDDGGKTWAAQNINDTLGQGPNYIYDPWKRISCPSSVVAYALSDNSLLYKTTDGGGSQNNVGSTARSTSGFFLLENPASQEAVFKFNPFTLSQKLEVFDQLGRMIKTISIPSATSSFVLDLQGIAPGQYFCRIGSDYCNMVVK